MRARTVSAIMLLSLGACGGEPADSVAAPGVPAAGDVRPPISTIAPAPTTRPPTTVERTTTTVTVTPTVTPNATPPPSSAASATVSTTTVAASTTSTTVAPTTTELVYVAELPEGALFVGVEGPRSLAAQQQLIALAILPSTAADSKYGPGTAAGVRRFQESQGLIVDGVAGPVTLAALAAAVAAGPATTPPTTSDE